MSRGGSRASGGGGYVGNNYTHSVSLTSEVLLSRDNPPSYEMAPNMESSIHPTAINDHIGIINEGHSNKLSDHVPRLFLPI